MSDLFKSTIRLYDELGKKYIKNISGGTPKEIFKFVKLLPKKSKVLEVGCAGGRDCEIFIEHGFEVTGIDVSKVFIAEARKNVPKATFLKMDARNLKFSSVSFDGIWANASLLHLKRQEIPKVLKSFHRILKPGGIIHVNVKYGKGRRVVKEGLFINPGRVFTFFNKGELEKLVKDANLKVIYSGLSDDTLARENVKWVTVWGKKPN